MSEPTPTEAAPNGTGGSPAPRSSSTWLVRATVLLFLLAVIGAECLVASLCLPASNATASAPAASDSHSPTEGAADKGKGKGKGKDNDKEKKGHPSKKGGHNEEPLVPDTEKGAPLDQVEVDLEQFSVTAHQPSSNTTTRIDFHLYGVVNESDKADFDRLLKANQQRIREQVLVIVRSSEAGDLADAGLGLIKRQILEKTNALLGKPLVRAIIVSEFSYIEQ